MVWDRRKIVIAAAAGLAAAGLVIGLVVVLTAGSAPLRTQPGHSPSPAQVILSPFTGEPVRKLGPVLIVKIDNLAPARPQTGLTRADIVYVLPVEGGLSRLMAVFSAHFPPVIGPVRSSREDDIELLRQFGRPAFAYSGADPRLLPLVHRARIVDLYDGLAGGYYRDPGRFAPDNLTPVPASCWPRRAGRARHTASASGSGRPRRVAASRSRARSPIRPRRSGSAGLRRSTAGWCGWMALPR